MTQPAGDLSDLHGLHQHARAIRDRLESGPKTLATRKKVLATRQAALDAAIKALKDSRAHTRNIEVQLKQIEARIDDHKTKLNQAKKQVDYDAIRNQIAHENAAKAKFEDQILQAFENHETEAAEVARLEAEHREYAAGVQKLETDLAAQRGPDATRLQELDAAIAAAEVIIPADQRDQYRRVVNNRGAEAMASVEDSACTGCNVAVTSQMLNDLINRATLVFCRSCGRVLYLSEKDHPASRKSG